MVYCAFRSRNPVRGLSIMFYRADAVLTSWRLFAAVLMLCLLSITASAYTIVMRDGRRVSIPNEFVVSNVTLTYEAAESIQVTLQLATIDITATERANNQPPGTFLQRAQLGLPVTQQTARVKEAQRSVTNEDLQKFRATRMASEAMYERRRRELGLPSAEEIRRQARAEVERSAEAAISIRSREYESESYWRSRASTLRSELTATDAQIDFVRARLNETPVNGAFGFVAAAVPFAPFGNSVIGRGGRPIAQGPGVFRAPGPFLRPPVFNPSLGGTQIGARVHFGNRRSGSQIVVNAGRFGSGPARPFSLFGSNALLAIPFEDYSYERSVLVMQLDELLAHRAGLQARWRDLEEEARRAGAYPGWLRR
jgi:hypothetical protein